MKSFILASLLLSGFHAQSAEYLVKYRNSKGLNSIYQMVALKSADIAVVDQHDVGSYVVVNVKAESEGTSLAELMLNPDIEWINENGTLHTMDVAPVVPVAPITLKNQWAMAKVGAEKAWERAGNRGGRQVIVAVIDTGVDYSHQSLAPNMLAGYDFADRDDDPMDETSKPGRFPIGGVNKGHGTHCSGIIGATGRVNDGVIGISPNVSILPIRFMNSRGAGNFNDAIKAIDYAVESGAHVISASWGGRVRRSAVTGLIEAVERATAQGVIFVVAAGNSGENNDQTEVFPANVTTENTIAVAASDVSDEKPAWSNYGKERVHVAAPGAAIMSTLPKDTYLEMSGTSMAAPMVAGLVALLKAQDNDLTGAQIRALIQVTGAPVNIESACNCRIDAFKAVDHLISEKPWLVPAAFSGKVGDTQKVSMAKAEGAITFAVQDPTVASVDHDGLMTYLKAGTTRLTATDSRGQTAESLDIVVQDKPIVKPPTCPYQSERLCRWTCAIMRTPAYCKKP